MNSRAPLNILLISHGLPPESVGGVEQHVEGLARALSADGHRVHVYCRTGGPGDQGTRTRDDRHPFAVTRVTYRYEGLDSLHSLYARPELDASFRAFLSEHSFDVAHIHHLTGMSTGLPAELARAGIPTAMTLHDYWIMCPRGQMWHRDGTPCERVEPKRCGECLAPNFGGWLPPDRREDLVADLHRHAREVLGQVDSLVVPSARVVPFYRELGIDPARIRVVENGVDTEALRALPAATLRPGQPVRVGYLGTLIPSKGLTVLVRAIQELGPEAATLDIWGNAVDYHGDRTYLSQVFHGLTPADRMTYHGPYRTSDLPEILSRVDVVAAPALWHEAFGLTVREALAAGRPVVVSRIGGLQDAVEDGVEGAVVPAGNPAALADAVRRITEDPAAFGRMAAAARTRARGFADMAAELTEIYRATARAR